MGTLLMASLVFFTSCELSLLVRVMVCLGKSSVVSCTAYWPSALLLVGLNDRVQDCKRTERRIKIYRLAVPHYTRLGQYPPINIFLKYLNLNHFATIFYNIIKAWEIYFIHFRRLNSFQTIPCSPLISNPENPHLFISWRNVVMQLNETYW